MSVRPGTGMWLALAVAAAAAAGGGFLQAPLDDLRRQHELMPAGVAIQEDNPDLAVVNILPGGLRAWGINYLWIRSQSLHQQERYYDARQRAEWICKLMPYHPDVWTFQAWNLAFNISANTHTPQERWNWVRAGLELLRDQAIPRNPKAIVLYKELGWLFFFKMGLYTDEMHLTYKQRWAAEMQRLLGAPPYGSTREVIDAFRPIARMAQADGDALLDKSSARQGRSLIQEDRRARLLAEPGAAEYAARLAAAGVGVDETLLAAWNRFSREPAAEVVRLLPPRPDTDRDRAVAAVINDSRPDAAEARAKLLAFVRAQILWNRYRMDPEWMLRLMEKYQAPMDWRHVMPHSLYWVTYGLHAVENVSLNDIDSLNTDRIALNCLKELTWIGQMIYDENPQDPQAPLLGWSADWRYIDPTQNEFLDLARKAMADRGETFKENILKDGHINYLVQAIAMLYAGYRRDKARELYDWIRENYDPRGEEWKLDLEDFILFRLGRDGAGNREVADSQVTAALVAGLEFLARGNDEAYRRCVAYARRVYDLYQKGSPDRVKLVPFDYYARGLLAGMLVRPQGYYRPLSLVERSLLYARSDPRLQVLVYDAITPLLRPQCEGQGFDFDRAFPEPPGLEEFRADQRRELGPPER